MGFICWIKCVTAGKHLHLQIQEWNWELYQRVLKLTMNSVLLWMFKENWVLSLLSLISMHWSLSAFVLVEGELSCQCGEIAHWSITALWEKKSLSRLSHDSIDLLKEHTRGQFEKFLQILDRSSIHIHPILISSAYITDRNIYNGECWNGFSWRFCWEYMNVSSV